MELQRRYLGGVWPVFEDDPGHFPSQDVDAFDSFRDVHPYHIDLCLGMAENHGQNFH
jgi:hypothetical protein